MPRLFRASQDSLPEAIDVDSVPLVESIGVPVVGLEGVELLVQVDSLATLTGEENLLPGVLRVLYYDREVAVLEETISDDGDFALGKKLASRAPFLLSICDDVADSKLAREIFPSFWGHFLGFGECTREGEAGCPNKHQDAAGEGFAPPVDPKGLPFATPDNPGRDNCQG